MDMTRFENKLFNSYSVYNNSTENTSKSIPFVAESTYVTGKYLDIIRKFYLGSHPGLYQYLG
jgi:hypothetical protein